MEVNNSHNIPHTLRFPPTSLHIKCYINIAEKTFEKKIFNRNVVCQSAIWLPEYWGLN